MKEKYKVGEYIKTIPLGICIVKRRVIFRGKLEYHVTTRWNNVFIWIVPNKLVIRKAKKKEHYNI